MINTNWTYSFICESFTEASNLKDGIDGEYDGRLVTAVAGRMLFVCPVEERAFGSVPGEGKETIPGVIRKVQARIQSDVAVGGHGVSYR